MQPTLFSILSFVAMASCSPLAGSDAAVVPDVRSEPFAIAQGPRDAIVYDSSTSVRFFRRHAAMGGFRFRGAYSRGMAPVLAMPPGGRASVITDLGAETKVRPENWYAIFAVAQAGQASAQVKVMPFLRVGKVDNGRLVFMPAGEGLGTQQNQPAVTPYAWQAENILKNTDALVISENNRMSGRVVKILSNSSEYLSVDKIGEINQGDFILPAPPGYINYFYIGSFYFDTDEVRNFYDSGTVVKAKMISLNRPDLSKGMVSGKGQIMDAGGYISPLASALIMESSGGLSTSSLGQYVEYIDPDGSGHVIETRAINKVLPTTEGYVFSNILVPFLYHQKFFYRNAGEIAKARIGGSFEITGWVEP